MHLCVHSLAVFGVLAAIWCIYFLGGSPNYSESCFFDSGGGLGCAESKGFWSGDSGGAWDVQNPKYSGLDKAFGNESKLAEIDQRHVKHVNTTRFVHQRFQSGRNSTLEGGPPPHQIPMVDLIPCSGGRSPPEACKNQVFIRFVR